MYTALLDNTLYKEPQQCNYCGAGLIVFNNLN